MAQGKVKEEEQVKVDSWGQPVVHGDEPVHETIEKDNAKPEGATKDQSKEKENE